MHFQKKKSLYLLNDPHIYNKKKGNGWSCCCRDIELLAEAKKEFL